MSYRAMIQIRDHGSDSEMFFTAGLDDSFGNVERFIEHAVKLNGNPKQNKAFDYIATTLETMGCSGRTFYSPSESNSWREKWADQFWTIDITQVDCDCITVKASCYDPSDSLTFYRRIDFFVG